MPRNCFARRGSTWNALPNNPDSVRRGSFAAPGIGFTKGHHAKADVTRTPRALRPLALTPTLLLRAQKPELRSLPRMGQPQHRAGKKEAETKRWATCPTLKIVSAIWIPPL